MDIQEMEKGSRKTCEVFIYTCAYCVMADTFLELEIKRR